jgi:hypothetical protein
MTRVYRRWPRRLTSRGSLRAGERFSYAAESRSVVRWIDGPVGVIRAHYVMRHTGRSGVEPCKCMHGQHPEWRLRRLTERLRAGGPAEGGNVPD